MDFILGFTKMRFEHDIIFVILDYPTNMDCFIPINTLGDALIVANKLIKEIVQLLGFPKVIVSNKDPKFTS